jgi:hypothetical protein
MKTLTRKLAALAVVAALPIATAAAAVELASLTFSYEQSQSEETAQTATGGDGSIAFTGSLTTATPCYSLTANHRVTGPRITLTVTAVQEGEMCAQVITHNNYEGQISDLDAGTYRFQVVHRVGSSTETVYDEQVVVS